MGPHRARKQSRQKKSFAIRGIAVAPGLAMGEAFHYHDIMTGRLEPQDLEPDEVDDELNRFKRVLEIVKKDLRKMKRNVDREIGIKHGPSD